MATMGTIQKAAEMLAKQRRCSYEYARLIIRMSGLLNACVRVASEQAPLEEMSVRESYSRRTRGVV